MSSQIMLTGAQMRAARGLAGLTQAQLAQEAGIPLSAVRMGEQCRDHIAQMSTRNMLSLVRALETHVKFVMVGLRVSIHEPDASAR